MHGMRKRAAIPFEAAASLSARILRRLLRRAPRAARQIFGKSVEEAAAAATRKPIPARSPFFHLVPLRYGALAESVGFPDPVLPVIRRAARVSGRRVPAELTLKEMLKDIEVFQREPTGRGMFGPRTGLLQAVWSPARARPTLAHEMTHMVDAATNPRLVRANIRFGEIDPNDFAIISTALYQEMAQPVARETIEAMARKLARRTGLPLNEVRLRLESDLINLEGRLRVAIPMALIYPSSVVELSATRALPVIDTSPPTGIIAKEIAESLDDINRRWGVLLGRNRALDEADVRDVASRLVGSLRQHLDRFAREIVSTGMPVAFPMVPTMRSMFRTGRIPREVQERGHEFWNTLIRTGSYDRAIREWLEKYAPAYVGTPSRLAAPLVRGYFEPGTAEWRTINSILRRLLVAQYLNNYGGVLPSGPAMINAYREASKAMTEIPADTAFNLLARMHGIVPSSAVMPDPKDIVVDSLLRMGALSHAFGDRTKRYAIRLAQREGRPDIYRALFEPEEMIMGVGQTALNPSRRGLLYGFSRESLPRPAWRALVRATRSVPGSAATY